MAARGKGQGALRQLASGRWQAKIRGTDGVLYPAPSTFETKLDGDRWLAAQARDLARDQWQPPVARAATGTLTDYSTQWLVRRDLKPSTRELYRDLLDKVILPDLGHLSLDRLQVGKVADWYAGLDASRPTKRAHAYGLLRTICTTAYSEDLIPANPCRIRGGGSAKKRHTTTVATLAELEAIAAAMPARYRAMILLAAWCSMRQGELFELRRRDLDLEEGTVNITRAVSRAAGDRVVGTPKSDAGRRRVAIPGHLLTFLHGHLDEHVADDPDALVFPARHGGHMAPASLYAVFYPARKAAGRPDLRFHDLRHTGATYAAATGATLADLMHRLGHSTPAAALVYQHAIEGRDRDIADKLSGFLEASRVTLTPKPGRR